MRTLLAIAVLAGCGPGPVVMTADTGTDAATLDAGVDSGALDAAVDDAATEDAAGDDAATEDGGTTPTSAVDLLLMVDDSNSMAQEQAALSGQLERLVQALTSGDLDADGVADFPAVTSLHVGIVSSDMGIGPAPTIASCTGDLGDDGILATGSTTPTCESSYPSVFDFEAGGDPSMFAHDVGCVATLGTAGCGFEQQLDSVLKAVSPESPTSWTRPGYVPPVFRLDTHGHGGPGGANDGFLRDDSVLAVLLVTDEDDCSTADSGLFDPADPRFTATDLNLRCSAHRSVQYPVDRYVAGLLGLRTEAHRLVFGAITGVPTTSAGLAYDEILAMPEMEERATPAGRLVPSCSSASGGEAWPARRIVGVARGLAAAGAGTSVGSVCGDFAPAIDAFAAQIASAAEATD